MKLYYSNTSPYARKVRLAVHELELRAQLVEQLVSPLENPPELHAANPLGKIPALIVDGQDALFDSAVICAYLDSLSTNQRLIPSDELRWSVLRGEALADGMTDAAFNLVMEKLRPEEQQSGKWKDRWQSAIGRSLDEIERKIPTFDLELNLAHLATAAALGYLAFRLPETFTARHHPGCTAWLNDFAQRPSMQATRYIG